MKHIAFFLFLFLSKIVYGQLPGYPETDFVFDNKIEITSPGKLPPTVDFNDMQSGHSSIRNKILAPIFKRLGIIEQWGNGLKLIADELKKYPEIGLDWKEPGIAFRVIFHKKKTSDNEPAEVVTETPEKKIKKTSVKTSVKILELIELNDVITIPEIAATIGVSERSVERNLQKLQLAKKLLRDGSDKGGHWKILKKK